MSDFLYPIPDNPPDDPRDWIVAFNSGWLPIVIDAIDNLLHDSYFEGMPADASEQVDQLLLMLCTPYECEPPVSSSKRSLMLHQDSVVLHGNAIAFAQNSSALLNGYWRQNTSANNDEWTTGFTAPAGDYILRLIIVRTVNGGTMDLFVDDENVTQVEFYNSSTIWNVVADTSITLAEDGYHIIRGKVVGKSSSSSGYNANVITISVLPADAD